MNPSPSSPGRPSASLHFAVGEINGKLDQLMVTLLPTLTDHDNRITSLEAKINWLWGAGAVVVFIITAWETIRVVLHL